MGIREEPAGYDDHFDNDNESQQNASAPFLENRPREPCTLKHLFGKGNPDPCLVSRLNSEH